VCTLLSCVAAVSSLGQFGARYACLVFWGFLAETSLTGVLHRPDRCGAILWSHSVLLTGLTGVGQWTRVLVFRCVLESVRLEVGS
jgi:hypothetical protein